MPPCHSDLLFLKIGLTLLGLILFVGVPLLVYIYKKLTFRQGLVFTIAAFFMFGLVYEKPNLNSHYSCAIPMNSTRAKWSLTMYAGKNRIPSKISIMRSADSFCGRGKDKYGFFTVMGKISPHRIDFNKKYESKAIEEGALSSTIALSGYLEDSNNLVARGVWASQMKVGFEKSIFNPSRIIPVSDRWEAKSIQVQTYNAAKKCHLPGNLNPLKTLPIR